MTIPLDDITRKKLMLVRQLYERAVLQAESKHSYVDRIMSLVGFDLANETLLKILINTLNFRGSLKENFHETIKLANIELKKEALPNIPDEKKITYIHNLRNDAQHQAKYPNETDLSDCRTYTRDFLKQVYFNVWGIDFDSISLADAIQNVKVRNYLIEAEDYLKSGNELKATTNAKAALQLAFNLVEISIVGHIPDGGYFPFEDDNETIDPKKGDLKDAFIHLRNLMLLKSIGIELQNYIKYKSLTDEIGIHFYSDGNFSSNYFGNGLKLKDAEFVVEFVTNSILQIESLVGNMEKPFEI